MWKQNKTTITKTKLNIPNILKTTSMIINKYIYIITKNKMKRKRIDILLPNERRDFVKKKILKHRWVEPSWINSLLIDTIVSKRIYVTKKFNYLVYMDWLSWKKFNKKKTTCIIQVNNNQASFKTWRFFFFFFLAKITLLFWNILLDKTDIGKQLQITRTKLSWNLKKLNQ